MDDLLYYLKKRNGRVIERKYILIPWKFLSEILMVDIQVSLDQQIKVPLSCSFGKLFTSLGQYLLHLIEIEWFII